MSLFATSPRLARWTMVLALAGAARCPAQGPSGPAFTNSLGMEFIRVEPGVVRLDQAAGSRQEALAGLDYDQPFAHQVRLTQPFYISKDRVAQRDFQRSERAGTAADVSWNDAAAFCAWLTRQEHREYRLPTEAEYLLGQGAHSASREWVQDWHGVLAGDEVTDPVGPLTGTTRLIREGPAREALSPDATSTPWGLKPTGFRVVLAVGQPLHATVSPPPYCQAAIKQSSAPARQGPDPRQPYFRVRMALPIPPDNDTNLTGPLAGLDPAVLAHNHSPGLEVLPNGDLLAVYFSARNSKGDSECDPATRFIQARLRYGAEQWDPPELFCDFKPLNDQSGLLWTDGNTIRFFGGGRGNEGRLPFKLGVSTNNGATWSFTLPYLDAPGRDLTPQPIVNAFRAPEGAMYFAMDAAKDESFLWRSLDNGAHWHDMGGRTGGRHSTIVPLDDQGHLLSIGGKSTSVNGWSPRNSSSDWGATWSGSVATPFPALGGNQRPCLIRLANGHLCFVSDAYKRKQETAPPGWAYGEGCLVAISTNNGADWRIKRLPLELPHEADRGRGTLGYATVRQAPNGLLHLLATMTQPCLHYEFNEAWVFSDAAEGEVEASGGTVRKFEETYPDGTPRVTWSARICPHGRYLLDGAEVSYYANGRREHAVSYRRGQKVGEETFWAPGGAKVWTWLHDPDRHTGTWTHFWNNGLKRIESTWDTQPQARDLPRRLVGLAANGPATHWNRDGTLRQVYSFVHGVLASESSVKEARAR